MFGFSLTKLIFTVLIIAAVWYGYKWVQRAQIRREEEARERVREEIRTSRAAGRTTGSPSRPSADAEEMVKCPACEAYVPAQGMRNCGRAGCPYPG